MHSAPIHPGPCALCLGREKLERSHIMPRFVYRALEASGSDGPVLPLLCGGCEDRFSLWESQFARDIFHPQVAGRVRPVKYGPWLLKFAASVCWRILEHAGRNVQLAPLRERWSAECDDSLAVWRDFLRDRRPDVGTHPLHLVGWNSDATDRHIIAFEVVSGDDAARVRAQLGPLALVGLIGGTSPRLASEVRINREGKLKRPRVGGALCPDSDEAALHKTVGA